MRSSQQFVALIGRSIEHSLSPLLHHELFRRSELDWVYRSTPVEARVLGRFVKELPSASFAGANVTSPYKEVIVHALDRLAESARSIGAVNTIVLEEDALVGHNTDHAGIARSLRGLLDRTDIRAVVLGTGGAARAAVYELLRTPHVTSIAIRSRHLYRACIAVSCFNDARVIAQGPDEPLECELLINATPIGRDDVHSSPVEIDDLHGVDCVFDMNYVPAETMLMKQARRLGCRTMGGLEMFIGQALASFSLWTGVAPSDAGLDELLSRELERQGEAGR